MPAQNRVRCHYRGDAGEDAAPEDLPLGSESAALVIGQAKALVSELLLEDSVLLDEVIDGVSLMTVDPAREGREEKLEPEEIWHVTSLIGAIGAVP